MRIATDKDFVKTNPELIDYVKMNEKTYAAAINACSSDLEKKKKCAEVFETAYANYLFLKN